MKERNHTHHTDERTYEEKRRELDEQLKKHEISPEEYLKKEREAAGEDGENSGRVITIRPRITRK